MQEVVGDSKQDYWRPAKGSLHIAKAVLPESLCQRCGAELALGGRFCHVCGIDRDEPTNTDSDSQIFELFSLTRLSERIGINRASLVCFFIGFVCLVAAALTGKFQPADTLVDWQAVQTWRIEWLLAAVGTFLAGILLKKPC